MSLLDGIMSANGDANYSYVKEGRNLVRVSRIVLQDPDPMNNRPKPRFNVDGVLLHSSRADFDPKVEGGNKKGTTVRANDPFRYPAQTLARVRRTLACALSAKTGKPVDEATMGLVQKEGEDAKAFGERIKAEVARLLGPTQPLAGAIIVIQAKEGKNQQTGSPYTLFEPEVPNEDDLKNLLG